MVLYYHYTNQKGATAIGISRKIKMSRRRHNDAMHGEGVYFTTLGPKNDKTMLARNNWDGGKNRPHWKWALDANKVR